MKKLYKKYKKLLIFCITAVILCSSFCISSYAVEFVDNKLSFNIPIAQPQIERSETSGICYAEVLFNDSSAVEVVIINFTDIGLANETEPLKILCTVDYGGIHFKTNKSGIISMLRISSNSYHSIDIVSSQGSNAKDVGLSSYYSNIKGFRVYGADRVTAWADGSSVGLNNNFIVNYGSDIVANERINQILSSLTSIESHFDDLENYVYAQNLLLNSIFEEQENTNTVLNTISTFLQSKLDSIQMTIEGVWGTVQDIRRQIQGDPEEQPEVDDTAIVENEQAEQQLRDQSSQGIDNAEYLVGSFGQTADPNSNIGQAMIGIAYMFNEFTNEIFPDTGKLLNWSLTIGIICFILGMGQLVSRFKKGDKD